MLVKDNYDNQTDASPYVSLQLTILKSQGNEPLGKPTLTFFTIASIKLRWKMKKNKKGIYIVKKYIMEWRVA